MLRAGRGTDVPGGLHSLEVVLTGSCNLRCSYCYQERHSQRMEWRTLRAAVDLLLRSPRPDTTLSFYGGEPLLEIDLMRRAIEHTRFGARAGECTLVLQNLCTFHGNSLRDKKTADPQSLNKDTIRGV